MWETHGPKKLTITEKATCSMVVLYLDPQYVKFDHGCLLVTTKDGGRTDIYSLHSMGGLEVTINYNEED